MKKFALVLCLISTLLFTACGQEAAESSASIEETEFSQTQEVSETDGNAENSGYPETPETELKVNAPLAEDNEIGGIYNAVTGSYDEVKGFLEKSIEEIYEASDKLEYGELYHSFIFVDENLDAASGMLKASYEDGFAYENVWSIAAALGVQCSTLVGWWDGGSYQAVIGFDKERIVYEYLYNDGTEEVNSWEYQSDRIERNNILNTRLEQHNGTSNPLRVIQGDHMYYVLVGSYSAEDKGITVVTDATVNTEINTVGQVLMLIESTAYDKLQVLDNVWN